MTVRISTGMAEKLLGPFAFDSIFNGGCIEVRTGVQPASADLAPTGDLIARITRDGGAWSAGSASNGLRYTRAGRYAMKLYEDTWKLTGLAAGVAGWFRVLPNALDNGADSATAPRLDGAVKADGSLGDGQLVLVSTTITPATTLVIGSWWFALPPLGG